MVAYIHPPLGEGLGALPDASPLADRRLQALLATSLHGKLIHRGFRPLYLNAALARIYGYASAETAMACDNFASHFEAAVRDDPARAWARAMAGPAEFGRRRHLRANGEPFTAEVCVRRIPWDADGDALAVTVLDVTPEEFLFRDLREAKAEAEAASRSRRRLINAAGHQLRTPLNGAMGRLQLLAESELAPPHAELAREALLACQQLLHNIEDVLDGAALEGNQLTICEAPFLPREALAAAIATAAETTNSAGVELAVIGGARGLFLGDERRVRRIALALIEEAERRRPPGPVCLSASPHREGLLLRLVAPAASGAPGLPDLEDGGVDGMAIARGLASVMGGALIEQSDEHGWTASAYLPLPRAPAPAPVESEGPRDILVVEDHPGNRRLLELVLTKMGHRPTLAPGGLEGLAAVMRRPFDLILMDISMPGMDGFECTRRIRSLALPWSALPIAALTAHVTPDIQEQAADAGMDAFLSKPFELPKLAAAIALLTTSVGAAEFDQVHHDHNDDEAQNGVKRSHARRSLR